MKGQLKACVCVLPPLLTSLYGSSPGADAITYDDSADANDKTADRPSPSLLVRKYLATPVVNDAAGEVDAMDGDDISALESSV